MYFVICSEIHFKSNLPSPAYDDESTLVLALPEPIEVALQCLQFEKKNLCMEVYGNTRGDSQSDRNHPKSDGTTQNVTRRWLDYISRGRTNIKEEWKQA